MLEKIKKAISISRPLFWLAPAAAYAAGIIFGGTMRGPFETWEIILLTFPLGFVLYGLNDIYDFESDRKNPRKGGLWGVKLEEKDIPWVKKTAFAFMGLMLITALSTFNPMHIAFAIAGLLLVYFYSAPPIRLKSIPIVDSLANGGYLYICFGLGCSLSGSLLFLHPYVILATLCISGIHAITTIMDYDSDRKAGEKTFATVFGPRAPAAFSSIIFIIALFAFLNSGYESLIALIVLGIAVLLSLFVLVFPKPKNAKLAFKLLIIIALLIAYFYFFKYIILGQWFGDFSEQELASVTIIWGG